MWLSGVRRLLQRSISIESLIAQLTNYKISKQIGTGAGSKIYLAVDLRTSREVAIKHVVRASSDDERFMVQAENEYEIASQLDHPALRKCYDLRRIKRRLQTRELALIMELVEGLILEKALPNRLNTFLTLFKRIAEGLDALHQAGFVHTDIKPSNIMLSKGGVVKIIDLGQACPMNHRKERIQGTPDYIAPEQVRRMPLDRRTDVFNLGATMYWVLTSDNYPTALRGQETRAVNVLTSDKPVAPNEHNDKIPISLSKLVMECCSDNPQDRPSDMKKVMARLDVVSSIWKKQRESARGGRKTKVPTPGKSTPPSPEERA